MATAPDTKHTELDMVELDMVELDTNELDTNKPVNEPRDLDTNEPDVNDSERGATLVETALVTPLFVIIIMAIFELCFMTHNYLLATSAASSAGRAATVAGATAPADFLTLRALENDLASFSLEDVERVVIYKASGPDDEVPVGCLSTPVPAGLECNSYTTNDFFLNYVDTAGHPTGEWGCEPGAQDEAWCPTDRQDALSDPGGPDYVGVYLQVRQQNLTGMFDWDGTLEVNRISRIEPSSN